MTAKPTSSRARQTAAIMLFAVAALAVPCLATDAGAQAVASVGSGSARINLHAKLTVGYRMNVRQSHPVRVVARNAEATEIELPVMAASNVRWTLSVISPSGADAATNDIEVLDAHGTWRNLEGGNTAAVFSGAAPTNGQPVTVRLRLAPGADLDSVNTVRFVMTPSNL